MLDWLIIGGGPHGIHMAARLLNKGVPLDRIAIVDPNAMPLARWKHHAGNAGMARLRSPEVHNLDISPFALGEHAYSNSFIETKHEHRPSAIEEDFIPPYSRPSLWLFMHHVHSIVDKMDLMRRWKQERATSIDQTGNSYQVRTETGGLLHAKNVVLALGIGDQPITPPWAARLKAQHSQARAHHIFAEDFNREQLDENHDVIIVGVGISAAQLALSLLEINPNRKITLISRHFLKEEDFDSDPGWLGPTLLEKFNAERDYSKRRDMIREARNKGSLASEVMQSLQNAILHHKSISWEMVEIDRALWEPTQQKIWLQIRSFELDETQYESEGEIAYRLGEKAQSIEADLVVLATGFESKRPGGELIDKAIQRMSLPTTTDGFPIVDRHLRWRKSLFVMGPLAELEVGPVSRNISGARMAAERIIESLEAEESVYAPPSFNGDRPREIAR